MSTAVPRATDEVVAIRPGDPTAAATGTGWLQEFAATRDPQLRERIILAYVGLADRLAMRYRHSRGTTLEDLIQTARAGLIAAVDRYDPAKNQSFVPMPSRRWSGSSSGTCGTRAGACTWPGRARSTSCGCAGPPTRSPRTSAAPRPSPSWPTIST